MDRNAHPNQQGAVNFPDAETAPALLASLVKSQRGAEGSSAHGRLEMVPQRGNSTGSEVQSLFRHRFESRLFRQLPLLRSGIELA
jgi:hypothetical protein